MRLQSIRIVVVVLATALFATSVSVLQTPTASADVSASFDQVTTEPFGNFGGVEFQRHTGPSNRAPSPVTTRLTSHLSTPGSVRVWQSQPQYAS